MDPILLRFGATGEWAVKQAVSGEDRLRCWNLVYREYLGMGYIGTNALGYRYSVHDVLPETATFFVEFAGQTVGTVTLFPDSPLGLPADEAYRAELDRLRHAGRRPVEVGRLTIAAGFQHNRDILTRLFDVLSIAARRTMRGTDLVVTVNPSHAKFYRRMLCFERMGPEKSLASVAHAPAALLQLPAEHETALRRWAHDAGAPPPDFAGGRTLYPHLADRAQEERLVARMRAIGTRPLSTAFVERWFSTVNPLIPNLEQVKRVYLLQRLGERSYGFPGNATLQRGNAVAEDARLEPGVPRAWQLSTENPPCFAACRARS